MNSNGSSHDVWLLYECARCGATQKRSIHRRVREARAGQLDPYRDNAADVAALWALELGRGQPLSHRVLRPSIPAAASVQVHVEQPYPCRVRWDRLLAHELGLGRARVRRAWGVAFAPLSRSFEPRDLVLDGDCLELRLSRAARARPVLS